MSEHRAREVRADRLAAEHKRLVDEETPILALLAAVLAVGEIGATSSYLPHAAQLLDEARALAESRARPASETPAGDER